MEVEMEYFYVLTAETIYDIEVYGIAVALVCNNYLVIISAFIDISANREEVAHLVDMCNTLELQICHFVDVVEDFINK